MTEVGGATTTAAPAECVAGGFLLTLHPFLTHYLGGADLHGAGHHRHAGFDHRLDRRLEAGRL